MSKTVSVFGATGAQGAPVVREAIASGFHTRAVARNLNKVRELHPEADPVAASLDNADEIAQALEGADAAFLHLPMPRSPEDPSHWLKTFFNAARAVSLPLLVYTTGGPTGPRYPSSTVIDGGTGAMQAVLECGIPTIVLQPALYLENLLPDVFLPRLRSEGVCDYPPLPRETRVQWTSHQDQARIAVAAMSRPDLVGNGFEIGTPEALTGPELAEHLSRWLKRPVTFDPMDPEAFGKRVGDAFNSPGAAFALTDLYSALAKLQDADMVVDTREIERIFDVKLVQIGEHIANWPQD